MNNKNLLDSINLENFDVLKNNIQNILILEK